MTAKLSVQLYSLRDQMKDGQHAAVIKALGAAGFAAVETAGFYGMTPAAFRALCADHGLAVSSAHLAMPTPTNLNEIVETCQALGTIYPISGYWDDAFTDRAALGRTAHQVRWVTAALGQHGLRFALHNHWQEFQRRDGRFNYDWILDTCPATMLEIDTYWCCNFGAEIPAEMVRRYRERTALLHLKDGNFVRDQPMVACGSGQQDFATILAAADPAVLEWAIVELDACATDMLTAVTNSARYLLDAGLAVGRR